MLRRSIRNVALTLCFLVSAVNVAIRNYVQPAIATPRASHLRRYYHSHRKLTLQVRSIARVPNVLLGSRHARQKTLHKATSVVNPDNVKSNINSDKLPNILIITMDQLRYDGLNFIQNEIPIYQSASKIVTPNINRLADQGVHFRTAYTGCPSCACSRGVLRTGCTVARTGVQANALSSPSVYMRSKLFVDRIKAVETYDQLLVERMGYRSESFGKFNVPPIFYYGFLQKNRTVISSDNYNFSDSDFTVNPNQNIRIKYKDALQELLPMWNQSYETCGHGQQMDPLCGFPYNPIKLDPRYKMPKCSKGKMKKKKGTVSSANDIGRGTLVTNLTSTGVIGDMARLALERLASNPLPFILTASFIHPHPPQISVPDLFDIYWQQRLNLSISPSVRDPMSNSQYLFDKTRVKLLKANPGYRKKKMIKEWTAAYYGCIQEVDQYVGEFMDILTRSGIANNTLVILTADHGEMLGAHAMRGKSNMLEEAVRVPLVMAFPGQIQPGSTYNGSVGLIDLFSTIMDYAGASEYDQSDGLSLRRFIDGTSYNAEYDEGVVVSELNERYPVSNGKGWTGFLGEEPNFLVRQGDYKLIITKKANSSNIDMMYDLVNDPYEMKNLIGKRGYKAPLQVIGKAEHLKALLVEWMVRNNGGSAGYYSKNKYNGHEGRGDITEITDRRTWRSVGYWQSDYQLVFGAPAFVGGRYVRYEYLYIGRTKPGTLSVTAISIEGPSSRFFSVLGPTEATIKGGDYIQVKIAFNSTENVLISSLSAEIRVNNSQNGVSIVQIT